MCLALGLEYYSFSVKMRLFSLSLHSTSLGLVIYLIEYVIKEIDSIF